MIKQKQITQENYQNLQQNYLTGTQGEKASKLQVVFGVLILMRVETQHVRCNSVTEQVTQSILSQLRDLQTQN